MTYCLGMLLKSGLVLMADTRTNAGIDNFSTFRKLHVLCDQPGRQVYAATAGSLSLSQSAIGLLVEAGQHAGGGRGIHEIDEAESMFAVARLIGEAVAEVGTTTGAALAREHIDNSLELLVGGRVGEGPLKLFLVYTIGNFIECTSDVPFLQIGETKYGRPILDRALRHETPLAEAVKMGCLSFDSTMKSNLGVAMPIDVLVVPNDRKRPVFNRRIERGDRYFSDLAERWAELLYNAATGLPSPPWMGDYSCERPKSGRASS